MLFPGFRLLGVGAAELQWEQQWDPQNASSLPGLLGQGCHGSISVLRRGTDTSHTFNGTGLGQLSLQPQ